VISNERPLAAASFSCAVNLQVEDFDGTTRDFKDLMLPCSEPHRVLDEMTHMLHVAGFVANVFFIRSGASPLRVRSYHACFSLKPGGTKLHDKEALADLESRQVAAIHLAKSFARTFVCWLLVDW
jgi:hypothetical protein